MNMILHAYGEIARVSSTMSLFWRIKQVLFPMRPSEISIDNKAKIITT